MNEVKQEFDNEIKVEYEYHHLIDCYDSPDEYDSDCFKFELSPENIVKDEDIVDINDIEFNSLEGSFMQLSHSESQKDFLKRDSLKCVECLYSTEVKANFDKHRLWHRKKVFLKHWKMKIRKRIKLMEKKGGRFHCSRCLFRCFKKKSMFYHILKHRNNLVFLTDFHKCLFCSFRTLLSMNLTKHLKDVHKISLKKFWVDNQETKKEMKAKLRRQNLEFQVMKRKLLQSKNGYVCQLCSYFHKQKSKVNMHLKRHIGFKKLLECNICGFKTMSNNVLHKHLHCHILILQNYKCETCDFSCAKISDIKSHMLNHTRIAVIDYDGPLTVPEQKYQIERRNNVKKSKADKPTRARIKQISENKAEIKVKIKKVSKLNLRTISSKNSEELCKEEMFICESCSFAATSMSNLKLHQLGLHMPGENYKIYKCKECSFTSKYVNSFFEHKQTHERMK